ncbi:GNAT family N-acetyltransferase [Acidovorax sp. ST3]|uniref:GNAT family N-acetyltransferase n=1 Tax=Acidovorax sp. ST3 TaxID=2219062 RepID=UPI000DA6AC4B|nr:GNAT family N-acetyltransferase [Acidovorax sp. ST3]
MTQQQQVLALRPATELDEAFLCTVYRSVREPELLAIGWPEAQIAAFCNMQHRFRTAGYRDYKPPVECTIVLWEDTEVGMLAVCRDTERWLLVNIEILPHARGKGVGTAVIARLQREAEAEGVGLQLHTNCNSPVLRLYERCGFTCVASEGDVQRMEWSYGSPYASHKHVN